VYESSCSIGHDGALCEGAQHRTLGFMAYSIAITDEGWNLVSHLFDPPGRRGARATTDRRQMVDAMLFLARTGCQWRYLPERFGSWGAVWQQWRRWRDNGVWARAMTLLAGHIRVKHSREARVQGPRHGGTTTQRGVVPSEVARSRDGRVQAAPSGLARGNDLRATRSLAQAVTMLRRICGECAGLARSRLRRLHARPGVAEPLRGG
jgi:transposase